MAQRADRPSLQKHQTFLASLRLERLLAGVQGPSTLTDGAVSVCVSMTTIQCLTDIIRLRDSVRTALNFLAANLDHGVRLVRMPRG